MNLATFITALALVESGNNDNAVGKHGELGRYQITGETWYQWCPGTFNITNVLVEQERVVCWHTRWIRNAMPIRVLGDPLYLAAAWNCGLSRCQKSRWQITKLPKSTQRYVKKFQREYQKQLSKRSGPSHP